MVYIFKGILISPKREGNLIEVTRWMKHKDTMLSRINQTIRDRYYKFLLRLLEQFNLYKENAESCLAGPEERMVTACLMQR